jgi:hypothetical protein
METNKEIFTNISRIIIKDGRYYPQIRIKNRWENILSNTWDGKWYVAQNGFTGFQGIRNAELTLEHCLVNIKMESRRYTIGKIKKNMRKDRKWILKIIGIVLISLITITMISCAPYGDTRQNTEKTK